MLNRHDESEPDDDHLEGSLSLVLEVVAGPRSGARAHVESGRPVSIGHDYDNDVVLRHPSAAGIRTRLVADGDGLAITVLAGIITIHGLPIEAGRTVALPRWTPFSLGDACLVVGPEYAAAWPACRRLARDSATVPTSALVARLAEPDPDADLGYALPVPVETAARSRHWWGVVAAVTVVIVAALVPVLLATPARRPQLAPPYPALALQALRTRLSQDGFGHLRIEAGAGGLPVIAGLVDRDEDRAHIASVLKAASIPASLDLVSGEELARQVGDVLRLNGVRAEVMHAGRGRVEVRLPDPKPSNFAQIEEAIRRDVRGLVELALTASPPAEPSALPDAAVPVAAPNLGKRVVTVVYGTSGYVVTVDGARYFAGALLPSGHRIARISDNEVRLERDGRITRLAL
jgi:hypothetical protein